LRECPERLRLLTATEPFRVDGFWGALSLHTRERVRRWCRIQGTPLSDDAVPPIALLKRLADSDVLYGEFWKRFYPSEAFKEVSLAFIHFGF